ncbi:GGDEF domain-containing protein [Pseudomonas sp. 21LCFQ010]|uniref:GGDEF domain-containing protein n=1 Tax=Pseudomonas sp. 21LCFQ010 TaxID=2957506 RepID=UPI0020969C8C|nr:GGDEF domain-containing protein [Pseudomonas sp. 21LCFQ010]MCO8163218.1 GGDEF domain-containing protein [Pseudomonas sp. 21LCFQ010]
MQRTQDRRIRTVLHGGIVRAECLAISSWCVVQWVIYSRQTVIEALLLFFLMIAISLVQTFTRSDKVWRLAGVIFVLVFSASYKFLFVSHPELYQAFSLAFAVIAVLGASLLIRSPHDYTVTALLTWLIIWPVPPLAVPDANLYVVIFALFSVALGGLNNYSFMDSLRSILAAEQQYRVMAETDYLTGIYNRRAFMARFERLALSVRGGCFLMIDIDNFKRVNDGWGHDVGDQVLCALARCLDQVQGSHCHGRLGGEEFGVLLDTRNTQEAVAYTERLLQAVRGCDFLPCRFTVSAGLVSFERGADVSHVLKSADRKLYEAKSAGKDNFKMQVC